MEIVKVRRVKKNKLSGGFSIHYERCSPSDEGLYTHVVMEKDDYDRIIDEYETARKKVTKLEDDNQMTQDFAATVQDELDKARQDFESKLAEANAVVGQAITEAERQRSLNENLLRITKERANAKRGLTPKKEHTGYVLLSAEEHTYTQRYDEGNYRQETAYLPCWRIRLQTPYSVTMELENTAGLIKCDLINTVGVAMGIAKAYDIGKLTVEAVKDLWEAPDNFVFKTALRLNGVKGFWEVEYLTRSVIIMTLGLSINLNSFVKAR